MAPTCTPASLTGLSCSKLGDAALAARREYARWLSLGPRAHAARLLVHSDDEDPAGVTLLPLTLECTLRLDAELSGSLAGRRPLLC